MNRYRVTHDHIPNEYRPIVVQINYSFMREIDFYGAANRIDADGYRCAIAIFICHPATGTIEERMEARERKNMCQA